MEMLIFLLFAALALGSALVVVVHTNPVYSTMALVLTLFSLAVLFVMLGAPFVGVLQVLVYTGAILVLFLFVIMLLNIGRNMGREESQLAGQRAQVGAALVAALVFGGLVVLGLSSLQPVALPRLTAQMVSLEDLARELFTHYLLPFEIVGLLLLVAVIGATVAARRPPREDTLTAAASSPVSDPREPQA